MGEPFTALSLAFKPNQALEPAEYAQAAPFFIAGVWRDYARQSGAITLGRSDYLCWTGDTRVNDMAFWLEEGASHEALQSAMRSLADRLAGTPGGEAGRLL